MNDKYSSRILRVFLNLLPNLTNLVIEQEDYFEITETCPAGWNLRISTEDEQLTIEFAEYHCHFGGYAESIPEKDASDAANLVQALRTGKTVLVVWYSKGVYAGSEIIENIKIDTLLVGKDISFIVKRWFA